MSFTDEGRAFTRELPVGQISVQPGFEKFFAFAVDKINSIDSPVRGIARAHVLRPLKIEEK